MTTATAVPNLLQPEQLAFLWEARAASALLSASIELGVLDRLNQGPADAAALAADCGIRKETVPALLSALVSLGLAEPRERGEFVGVTDNLGWFLELLRRWDGFADGLRQRPAPAAGEPPGADVAFCRTVGPLAALCAPAVGPASKYLAGAGRRVLDLGSGAAPWSLGLATADPDVVVTAVELPAVLPITREAVSAAGRETQFRFLEEDIFAVDFDDAAFDLVILGNLCHLFEDYANRRLLSRAARWLAPGGMVAIIDFLPNERRDGPRALAMYAVELVRRTPEGQLYPFSSYAGWLREAGFERIERLDLARVPPVTLVSASRPGT